MFASFSNNQERIYFNFLPFVAARYMHEYSFDFAISLYPPLKNITATASDRDSDIQYKK